MKIGAVLHRIDQLAWKATDAVLAAIGQEALAAKTQGWIVSPVADGSWLVRFAHSGPNGVFSHFDVAFVNDEPGEVVPREPPVRLEGFEEARFTARQTAIDAARLLCPRPYNTVVIPASIDGHKGWYVYLLVGKVKEHEVPMAGHIRVLVSADGGEVLENTPLSNTCLILEPTDDEGRPVKPEVLVSSHILTPTPTEAHVFLSYSSPAPLVISTEAGIWGVMRGETLFLRSLEELPDVSDEECRELPGEECGEPGGGDSAGGDDLER